MGEQPAAPQPAAGWDTVCLSVCLCSTASALGPMETGEQPAQSCLFPPSVAGWRAACFCMGHVVDCLRPKSVLFHVQRFCLVFLAGVWTQYDDTCHFQNEGWRLFRGTPSVSKDSISYVVKEFRQECKQNFTDLERKIHCYILCSKARKRFDVKQNKTTEVGCKKEEVCNDCPAFLVAQRRS